LGLAGSVGVARLAARTASLAGRSFGNSRLALFTCARVNAAKCNCTSATVDVFSNKSIVLHLHDRVQTFAALIGDFAAAWLAPGGALLFNSHHPDIATWAQRTVLYALIQFHCAILNAQCGMGVAIRWRAGQKS
jgi:hypothetical protein